MGEIPREGAPHYECYICKRWAAARDGVLCPVCQKRTDEYYKSIEKEEADKKKR